LQRERGLGTEPRAALGSLRGRGVPCRAVQGVAAGDGASGCGRAGSGERSSEGLRR